jgi:hypothetical protein
MKVVKDSPERGERAGEFRHAVFGAAALGLHIPLWWLSWSVSAISTYVIITSHSMGQTEEAAVDAEGRAGSSRTDLVVISTRDDARTRPGGTIAGPCRRGPQTESATRVSRSRRKPLGQL